MHLVFSTKERRSYLQDAGLRERLHAYMAGTCRNLDSPALTIGGVADHVHLLFHLGRSQTLADLVRDVKKESTRWLRQEAPGLMDFQWQAGYGAFSVSHSLLEPVREYIQNQEKHHQRLSFQDEFRKLLQKSGMAWDERYVWD